MDHEKSKVARWKWVVAVRGGGVSVVGLARAVWLSGWSGKDG